MMFFSSALAYPPRQVVFGQYLGIGALVAISALGVFLALVIPSNIIGLMGLLPVAIGIKKLFELRKKDDEVPKEALQKKASLAFLAVAAVTFANGGDNIGVYVPLFAGNNEVGEITMLVAVFMAMTAVWCATAYYLVNHPLVAMRIRRTGHKILPFVLIGLGTYILAESFLIPSF